VLKDEGGFFVGGKQVVVDHPTLPDPGQTARGTIVVDQIYVQYRVPARVRGLPVVMVHGASHTGATFETTPDGREGWATYFVRHGHPVYVVDHAGRGRSGFNSASINAAKAKGDTATLPVIALSTKEGAWVNFRIGPVYGTAFPGAQFPVAAYDTYLQQLAPNAESTLEGGGANTIEALTGLMDRIGPAVLLVHSQSGAYGLEVARRRPKLVKAVVSIEGGCEPLATAADRGVFAAVPVLSVWGDNSRGAVGYNGDVRREGCAAMIGQMQPINRGARLMLLTDMGIRGNSHMMMMDRNNLQIADLILAWIVQEK
jgi:pimeloyl-ACP methyl ester carboxylesterase